MDIIQVFLIIGVVCGVLLVILSFFGKKENKTPEPSPEVYLDKRLEVMDTTLSEADSILSELGGISQSVMREMDQKYNELLFLYNLIDEKKKEIDTPADNDSQTLSTSVPVIGQHNSDDLTVKAKDSIKTVKPAHPLFTRIVEMKLDGMTVAQIAKQLNMGQGEVSLIMELGKDS